MKRCPQCQKVIDLVGKGRIIIVGGVAWHKTCYLYYLGVIHSK